MYGRPRKATARTGLATATTSKAMTDRARELEEGAAVIRSRLAHAPATASADPGATALSSYLGIFDVSVSASLVGEWMVLVGVVALEIGSALAAVLVQTVRGSAVQPRGVGQEATSEPQEGVGRPSEAAATVDTSAGQPASQRVSKAATGKCPRGHRLGHLGRTPAGQRRTSTGQRIVDALRDSGGRLEGASVRGIARLIGSNKSTVHGALAGLIAAGVVARAAQLGSTVCLTGNSAARRLHSRLSDCGLV